MQPSKKASVKVVIFRLIINELEPVTGQRKRKKCYRTAEECCTGRSNSAKIDMPTEKTRTKKFSWFNICLYDNQRRCRYIVTLTKIELENVVAKSFVLRIGHPCDKVGYAHLSTHVCTNQLQLENQVINTINTNISYRERKHLPDDCPQKKGF